MQYNYMFLAKKYKILPFSKRHNWSKSNKLDVRDITL